MPHNTQAANGLPSHVPPPEQSKLKRRLNVNYVWHATTVRAPRAVRNGVQSFINGRKKPASSDEAGTGDTRKRVNGAKVNKEMIGPPIPQDASEQLPSPAHDNGRNFPVIEQYNSSPRVPGAQVEVAGRTSGRPGPPAVSTPLRNRVSTFDGRTGPDEITPQRIPYDQHKLGKVREVQNGLRLGPSIPDEPGSPSQDGRKKRFSLGEMWGAQATKLRTVRRKNGLRLNPYIPNESHHPSQADAKEHSRIEGMWGVQAQQARSVRLRDDAGLNHSRPDEPSVHLETAKKPLDVDGLCQTQMGLTRTARDNQLTGRKPTTALTQSPRKSGSRLRPTNGHRQPWL